MLMTNGLGATIGTLAAGAVINNAAGAAVMETIRTTGNLDKDTEEQLKKVLAAYTDSFVKAH